MFMLQLAVAADNAKRDGTIAPPMLNADLHLAGSAPRVAIRQAGFW